MRRASAAGAIANALDFQRERRIAHALTRGFVPGPAPSLPGLQIGLDESTAPQTQGASVFKPQTGADSIAQPKIVIKRKIGSRLELSYGQTVSNSTTCRVVSTPTSRGDRWAMTATTAAGRSSPETRSSSAWRSTTPTWCPGS